MQKQNQNSSAPRIISALLAALVFVPMIASDSFVSAAAPQGNDWFEIHADPFTGKDDSGDGGTGNPADFNYFYVGQTFTANTAIKSNGTTAANIWVDFDSILAQLSNLSSGNYFNHSGGLTIDSGRLKATGYNVPTANSSGQGNFASFKVNLQKPSATNYGTGNPAILDINTGAIGQTTESNIALNGQDLLDDAKDFKFHVWADTKKPYALNPVPTNAATNVSVTSPFSFQLRDSLHGEGDNTGVGTGVNMNSAQASITANDGTGPVNLKANATYTCTGVWGSNVCDVTVVAPNATAFAGDTRKWKYGAAYSMAISNYDDLASPSQNQLGDANGPNRMDSKTFTFTTEADTVPPQVFNALPASNSIDNPLNGIVSFDVEDRKTYPAGMSGSGMKDGACRINVSSSSFGSKTYKRGDPEVTATNQDYGTHFIVDPATDFGSNETVTVKISDCADLANNKILEKTYTFKTVVVDTDKDGVLDVVDNCPLVPNPDQKDTTKAWHDLYVSDPVKYALYKDVVPSPLGDVCNPDIDGDTVPNATDNCPLAMNTDQKNTTKSQSALYILDPVKYSQYKDVVASPLGDVCNPDIDGDGICDKIIAGSAVPCTLFSGAYDNCPLVPNPDQKNTDKTMDALYESDPVKYGQYKDVTGDDFGDACDPDIDEDGIPNATDNCPLDYNSDQQDTTKTWHGLFVADPVKNAQYKDVVASPLGDVCNPDIDGDTVPNATDNCPLVPNLDQKDSDKNGTGDACEAGLTVYHISAKSQKRVKIGNSQDLSLNASLKFFSPVLAKTALEDSVSFNNVGFATYNTKLLQAGNYNIGLKGEACLTKVIPNFTVVASPAPHTLDFTLGNTFELIVGDLLSDDRINSFDLAKLLKTYGSTGAQVTDLNKDGRVNAMDMALLVLNYMKKGDVLTSTPPTL
jgi:hypothetical protein